MLGWDPFEEARRTGRREVEFVPCFEVKETKDSYLFKADLPGVREEDLDISITGNRLTVSGKREDEKKEEGDRYYALERSYGSFSRSFSMPEGVELDSARADLKNGELTIFLAKKPEIQARKIPLFKGQEGEAKA
jgi:HSP20 family protein